MKYQIVLLSSFFITSLFAMESNIHQNMLLAIKNSDSTCVKNLLESDEAISLPMISKWVTKAETKKNKAEAQLTKIMRSQIKLYGVVVSITFIGDLMAYFQCHDNNSACTYFNGLSNFLTGISVFGVLNAFQLTFLKATLPAAIVHDILQKSKKAKESEVLMRLSVENLEEEPLV